MDIVLKMLPFIIITVIVLIAFLAITALQNKIREFSRSLFGTNSIVEGINKQKQEMSETPRSLHSMTAIYLPNILRDFPEFDCELYKNKAKSLLRSYFTAVSTKKASALTEECSLTLKNYVYGVIEDLNVRNVKQVFNQSVIHDIEIARYIKNGATATILFVASVGQYSYIEDMNGKVVFGDKNLKNQTVYEIGLVYVQDVDRVEGSEGLGINCPNCGAPIKSLGHKFCDYCGTSIVEVNARAWKFDSVKEQTTQRRQY